jgi:hypothetical protein
MPSANAPKAPWVAVWESPQTTTVPGRVVAVFPQRVHLRHAHGIGAADAVTVGRDVVVHRGHNQTRPAHAPALDPEAFECLWRGHLVDEMQVDVEQ